MDPSRVSVMSGAAELFVVVNSRIHETPRELIVVNLDEIGGAFQA